MSDKTNGGSAAGGGPGSSGGSGPDSGPDSGPEAPGFIPQYNKPDAPGIAMNFDNTVSLYHIVEPEDSFEQAVNDVFGLVKEAQAEYPNWPRVFYLDIRGHKGERGGFDEDFFEFQQEFWFATIAHFVTAFDTPLLGGLVNPEPQKNELPDELVLRGPQ